MSATEAQDAASNSTTSYACERSHSIVSSRSDVRQYIVTNVLCTRRKSTGCVVSASGSHAATPGRLPTEGAGPLRNALTSALAIYSICRRQAAELSDLANERTWSRLEHDAASLGIVQPQNLARVE